MWHGHKGGCNTNVNKHPGMHVNCTNTAGHCARLALTGYIIAGWPEIKDQVQHDIRMYWSFRDDMAVINGIIMEGRCGIIPEVPKAQALYQLHINHMGIEKTRLLACESIYWVNINDGVDVSADTSKGKDDTS